MCGDKSGDRGGNRTASTPCLFESRSERPRELPVPVHQQILLPAQESLFGIGHVPRHLEDPRFIRIRRQSGKMHTSTTVCSSAEICHPAGSSRRLDLLQLDVPHGRLRAAQIQGFAMTGEE